MHGLLLSLEEGFRLLNSMLAYSSDGVASPASSLSVGGGALPLVFQVVEVDNFLNDGLKILFLILV